MSSRIDSNPKSNGSQSYERATVLLVLTDKVEAELEVVLVSSTLRIGGTPLSRARLDSASRLIIVPFGNVTCRHSLGR